MFLISDLNVHCDDDGQCMNGGIFWILIQNLESNDCTKLKQGWFKVKFDTYDDEFINVQLMLVNAIC